MIVHPPFKCCICLSVLSFRKICVVFCGGNHSGNRPKTDVNLRSLIKDFTFIINVVYKNYMYLILQHYYNDLPALK